MNSVDSLVMNAGRLRILKALAAEPQQEFVRLREVTQLTDGNLATHARRLQAAGLVRIDKLFRDAKPVTRYHLTHEGRSALETHARELMDALGISPRNASLTTPLEASAPETIENSDAADEWVD